MYSSSCCGGLGLCSALSSVSPRPHHSPLRRLYPGAAATLADSTVLGEGRQAHVLSFQVHKALGKLAGAQDTWVLQSFCESSMCILVTSWQSLMSQVPPPCSERH